jgi:hypothetical protein
MYCIDSSSPTLTDCMFSGNQTDCNGGGMSCFLSSPTLTDCTFSGNQGGWGGGMHSSHSSPTLTGCTFSGNVAYNLGGGMYSSASPLTLAACIIAFSTQGEAVCCSVTSPSLACCDVYGNAGGDWVGCIADQYGVNGNFSDDPLFCDMLSGDFTLCANSRCLPENNDCNVLIGAHGEGCGPCESLVESTSWGAIKAMYR